MDYGQAAESLERKAAELLLAAWKSVDEACNLVGRTRWARGEDRKDWLIRVRSLRACLTLAHDRLRDIRSRERPEAKPIKSHPSARHLLKRLSVVGLDVVPDLRWELVERERKEAWRAELRERWEERRERDARWRKQSPNSRKEKIRLRKRIRAEAAGGESVRKIADMAREMRIRAGVE